MLNASRQIGTSVGLAVLGAIGVRTAIANLHGKTQQFPASIRPDALRQAQNVGGARITEVTRNLGSVYRHPAAESFVHGYNIAVGVGAACLLLAALVAVLGLRERRPTPPAEARATQGSRLGPPAPDR